MKQTLITKIGPEEFEIWSVDIDERSLTTVHHFTDLSAEAAIELILSHEDKYGFYRYTATEHSLELIRIFEACYRKYENEGIVGRHSPEELIQILESQKG